MNKLFISILSFAILISCGTKKPNDKIQPKNDTVISNKDSLADSTKTNNVDWENKAMDTIMGLPEVIDLGKSIEKNSKGKNHLTAILTETSVKNDEVYYIIKVGEDNGESVVGIYNFTVYTPSLKIFYSDPISGDEITFDEWRKQSKSQ